MTGSILSIALKSLWNRRLTAFLTVLAVALTVTLLLGVEKLRNGARDGFYNTISQTDLIVGAPTSRINLLLYSVFRIGNATANMEWEDFETIAAREDVAWAVPISLGDSHRGFRVLGTTLDYFDHYKYGGGRNLALADGGRFDDLYDAVIGAEVARTLGYDLGQQITLSHGIGSTSFANHDNRPFTIVGILAPTGTAVDKTVHVSLAAIEAIHVGWESGMPSPLARMLTADQVRDMDLTPSSVTAAFIGLDGPPTARLRVAREINTSTRMNLLAINPGEALFEMWQIIGSVETVLRALSIFVIAIGLVSILTSILTSLNERRREMAILRSLGARPWHIFALLLAEAALLGFLGALLGCVLVFGVIAVAGPWLEGMYNVSIGTPLPGLFDLYVLGGVTLAATIIGLVPAWRAYRNSLADGLSVRL